MKPWGKYLGWMAILVLAGNTVKPLAAGSSNSEETDDGSTATAARSAESHSADWVRIGRQALGFLVLEHGFRYLTEEGTRHPHIPFFRGFVNSLNNLHGWADGDPFLVSYVGHPMQGAVAGYIFAQNDRGFLSVEFGKNKPYWKSRLRAATFSWAYSEQFEIGPISEASIGNTQAFFPQQGFVDQVATPVIGLAWMIAEDSLDRFVVKRVEARTANPFVRLLVRGGLNPSRSLANVMAARPPWHRTDRLDPWERLGNRIFSGEKPRSASDLPLPITKFEFMATARTEYYLGPDARGACIGGGGAAAFRITPNWQFVADVAGCKLTHFGDNLSGDSLTYTIGPRWTANPLRRWTTYSQLLIGGRTLTHEEFYPARKAQLHALAAQDGTSLDFPDHARYTRTAEHTGLTVSVRGGVDVKLSPAIEFQVADLAYAHSWHGKLDGIAYTHALQLSGGLVLRIGTW
jgi:hypothetical protein